MFDRNKDGHISVKEIKEILVGKFEGTGLTEEDIKEVIEQVDVNGDQEIDFDEFVKCVNEIHVTVSKKNGRKKVEKKKK